MSRIQRARKAGSLKIVQNNAELTLLSNRIGDYWYISQGKTRIPGVNDAADMEETDVSPTPRCLKDLGELFESLCQNVIVWTFRIAKEECFLRIESRSNKRGKVMEKLGRGFYHPLAPRLRKLPAAAIGVRGDWGRNTFIRNISARSKAKTSPQGPPAPRSASFFLIAPTLFRTSATKPETTTRDSNRGLRCSTNSSLIYREEII